MRLVALLVTSSCAPGILSAIPSYDLAPNSREVGIPFPKDKSICLVRAIKAWLKAAKVKTGPVFRRVDRYGFVLKRRGLDPTSIACIVKKAAKRSVM